MLGLISPQACFLELAYYPGEYVQEESSSIWVFHYAKARLWDRQGTLTKWFLPHSYYMMIHSHHPQSTLYIFAFSPPPLTIMSLPLLQKPLLQRTSLHSQILFTILQNAYHKSNKFHHAPHTQIHKIIYIPTTVSPQSPLHFYLVIVKDLHPPSFHTLPRTPSGNSP